MSTDPAGAPKPIPPPLRILDRFKAMLKAIESNSRLSKGHAADVQPPLPIDVNIVRIYETLLSELTFNSKLLIIDLTVIAGEQRLYAEGIANAICDRICKVPVQQRLPALYLLDSVVKNIGTEYVRYFSARLPEVFAKVYTQVEPNLYPALRHLFGTWSNVFPPSVLRQIAAQLQFSAPEVQHERGTSALKIIGHKTDSTEAKSLDAGIQKFTSTNHVGQSAFSSGDKDFHPSLAARYDRPASSFGRWYARSAAAAIDSVAGPLTCGIERASPSPSKFDYALNKEMAIDEGKDGRLRNLGLDDAQELGNTCMKYNYKNRVELQRPRALIDAYGTDQGKQIHTGKPFKLDPLVVNGIDNKIASRTWQNTEEEEFDWEDMSPTFGDHNESNGPLPSCSLGNFKTTPGFEIQDGSQLDTKFEKRNLSNKAQPSAFRDSSNFIEDAVPTVGSGHGSSNTVTGLYNDTLQVPGPGFQEGRDMQRHQLESSVQHLNAEGSGRNILTVFSEGQVSSSTGEAKLSLTDNIRVNAEGFIGKSISSRLTSASVDTAVCTASVPISRGAWPSVNMYNSQPRPSRPNLPQQIQDLNCVNTVVNQMFSKSLLHEKQLDVRDTKVLHQQLQFTNQQAGPVSFTQQRSVVSTSLQKQLITSQVSHATVALPSNPAMPPLNFGYPAQGPAAGMSSAMSTPFPGGHYFWPPLNIPNISPHRPRGPLPSLHPGPPPVTSQLIPNPQHFCFISPQPSFLGKDVLGLQFDPDLKMRHESAIADLYFNLPRQCTTCGCRFKCQEQHSSHMDWHVTRNRVARNLKQRPSRWWFVSINMWLTGVEASGNVTLPGLVPSENVAEKKDDEQMAVPADDDQKVCALCGEAFEDFYSDETEDWMYKGAVYMNAPDGLTVGVERSQFGPIVHAKCRSDSSVVTSVDSGKRKEGYAEEGSQRKRMCS